MQNTSNKTSYERSSENEELLIKSLKQQPIILVIRLDSNDLESKLSKKYCFTLIESLQNEGFIHIEIAWSENPNWISIMKELKNTFSNISFGVSSIKNKTALMNMLELNITYGMSPFWDESLQIKARELGLTLIPGVFSPTEIQRSISFGCKIIKLFPAYLLGQKYLNQISPSLGSLPLIIAAGGLTIKDINPWLKEGYGAIILGRGIFQENQINPTLLDWLKTKNKS